MVNRDTIKRDLRSRFSEYLRNVKRSKSKRPIAELFDLLKKSDFEIYLFGGFPKDIYFKKNRAIPRDIDLVVNATDLVPLISLFNDFEIQISRFGGYKIKYHGLDVDIWPLASTWAFVEEHVTFNGIESLATTTFLNIESIAIEIFPKPSKIRNVILDGFVDAFENRLLELNLEKNPFPELNIARALHAAKNTGYQFGERLLSFMASNLAKSNDEEIFSIYKKKYGLVETEKQVIQAFLTNLRTHNCPHHFIDFQGKEQLDLFRTGRMRDHDA